MMKKLVCLLSIFTAVCVLGFEVPTLPPSPFPDTEAVTNLPLVVLAESPRRLRFSVELPASPSNNVEVAIGRDADCNGRLSLDESNVVVGYDCGEWFVRSAAKDSVTCEAVPSSGVFRRTYEIRSRNVDPSWNLVKVTRRGQSAADCAVAFELVESGFALRLQ